MTVLTAERIKWANCRCVWKSYTWSTKYSVVWCSGNDSGCGDLEEAFSQNRLQERNIRNTLWQEQRMKSCLFYMASTQHLSLRYWGPLCIEMIPKSLSTKHPDIVAFKAPLNYYENIGMGQVHWYSKLPMHVLFLLKKPLWRIYSLI